MVAQTDQLIMSAIGALEGPQEAKIVRLLLLLRDEVTGRKPVDRSQEMESLRLETMTAVNDYFRDRLVALPEIAAYLDTDRERAP